MISCNCGHLLVLHQLQSWPSSHTKEADTFHKRFVGGKYVRLLFTSYEGSLKRMSERSRGTSKFNFPSQRVSNKIRTNEATMKLVVVKEIINLKR